MAEPDTPMDPVIDLTAETVVDAEPQPAAATPLPKAQPKRRFWGAAALALIAAGIGAWAFRSYGAAWWPTDQTLAMEQRLNSLEASHKTLADQLKGLGTTLDGLAGREADLKAATQKSQDLAAGAVSAAEAVGVRAGKSEESLSSAQASLEEVKRQLAGLAAAPPPPPATDGAPPPVPVQGADPAALKALEGRVAALETSLTALAAKTGERGPDAQVAAQLSQALSDLKAKFALGAPYRAELDLIASLVPAAPGLDVLMLTADTGLPNAEQLGAELTALAATLPGAAPPPEPAAEPGGLWDSITSTLGSVVKVRTIGETDWRDLAVNAAGQATAGDLRQAVEALLAPGGDVPVPAAAWITKAKSRIAAASALASTDEAVLRQIVSLGGAK